jgi:hypothetical protein
LSTCDFKIPYTSFFNCSVDIAKLRPFGCLAWVLIPKEIRKQKLLPCCKKALFLGYVNDFLTYRFLKLDSKVVCVSQNATFDETIFPCLTNESLDQSSFLFNPFDTIELDDVKEPEQFDVYPNQERYLGESSDDILPVNCPLNEIIGDISSENIIHHRQRGVSESFATTACDVDEEDSLTYHQVMMSPDKKKWITALDKEKDNMANYEVWDVIKKTQSDKPLNCTWVCKIKPSTSNQAQEYKARLCVQGFREVFGKDYNSTFAPTGKLVSLRLLIAFVLQHNFQFHQIDVKCAFLNAPIQERITLNPPPGIITPPNSLLLLKKALCGLKQAPKEWHLTLTSWLLSVGFNRSYAEPWVFWSSNTWIYVHVDNIAIFSPETKIFKNLISKRFKIQDLGSAKHLLGMQVTQLTSQVHLTQTHYIEETLSKYQCQDLYPLATPFDPKTNLVKASEDEIDQLLSLHVSYCGLVGALNYLSVTTRPGITYSVGCLLQFLNKPGISHWNAAIHFLQYLKGTKDFGITLKKTFASVNDFISYVDASWANCSETSRSTTGYLILWNNNLISWQSKKQSSTLLSSTEAEYVAISELTKEILWMKMVLKSALKLFVSVPFEIFEDNQGAIKLANNEANHSAFKTKHMKL